MKNKWKLKRLLGVLVSCTMLLSFIPMTAFADDIDYEETTEVNTLVDDIEAVQDNESTPESEIVTSGEMDSDMDQEDDTEEAEGNTSDVEQTEEETESEETESEETEGEEPDVEMTKLQQARQPQAAVLSETSTVDYSKVQSESVTYDGYEQEDGVYKFYYTIHEGAGDNLVIDLSQCALQMREDDYQLPGDHYKFQILLQNESGNVYRYKDNSFVLAPGDASKFVSVEEGSALSVLTYDGQYLPLRFSGAMIPYYFYKDVFGVSSSENVSFEMMCQIYDYLADKGYTGDTAITDYMLDYYNAKRGVNYDSLQDLFADHPDWLDGNLVTNNGIWTMTEAELLEYIEKYPWIDSFVSVKGSGNNLSVQIKWPEAELAAVSYNSFYMGLFSVVYGQENVESLNPNGAGVDFSRAHAVGDYMAGTALYEETNQYFEGLTSEGFESGDTLEIWTGYGIDGPGMGNAYQNYEFTYYNIIELEQVKPIQMSLCDITIYTGGNGYDGVVNGTAGGSSDDNGFPIPGFYMTLPDELNDKLGSIQNLAHIVKLKYDDGKGDVREWDLDLYGTEEHSTDRGGYIYKFKITEGQSPVRVQLRTSDGQYIMSDDFDAYLDEQYKEYEMSVYNGAIDANYVTAEVTVNGKTYTYPIEEGNSATLTVRANIDEKHAEVVTSKEQITSGDFAAIASEDVVYYMNDKNVEVEDTSGVRLMVDELLDENVLVDYLKNSPAVEFPKGKLTFQQKYMDLVDINNGDTYLTLGEGHSVSVYWPVPEDYVNDGEAVIYHFDGVDRDYNTGDVEANIDELISIVPELVTINGTQYVEFETSSFSPFVLAYANGTEDETTSSNESDSDSDDSKTTAPQTGDTSNLALWLMMMAVSAAGIVFVIVWTKKRKCSK